ncbi:MAG: RdgB/HAM1 family non-canonical purine NTP pyrophosphatase [Chloroflexi bacterium]|nr:RdgB/HAM1 family non-canonical purine NTP pyrophosphatase [Chloroflexota bacterium]
MEFLLIGTSNPGKLREYGVLLAEVPARLLSLRDVGLESLDVEEPFETFEENAAHKVKVYAQASGLLTFADDSGLSVDALGGRPGVYSARYGGPTDRDRYMKLLGELETVPDEARTARFVCIAAAFDPQQERLETAEGVVEGRIARAPGDPSGGFGYDAVFIPEGHDVVFSELPAGEKHEISHRGRAARALLPALRRLLGS